MKLSGTFRGQVQPFLADASRIVSVFGGVQRAINIPVGPALRRMIDSAIAHFRDRPALNASFALANWQPSEG